MHRTYAAEAIQELLDQGFLAYGEGHTKARPRYRLTDWPTFAEDNVAKQIASLSPIEKAIVKASVEGKVDAKSPKAVVVRKIRDLLVSRGVLQMRDGGFVRTSSWEEGPTYAEDLIWLPNTFVQGAATELSPVARLKATGDVWSLRLLVDLYHAHNLAADGGVNKSMIRQNYERFKAGSMESHVIWAFKPSGYTRSTEGFFDLPFSPR
ncbi:hypothetical protein [Tunturiibacter gelidiferens]|uniref:hypothetical protein n=1 Tax=Tunturiibacter gelidiferens TaxID=3069689 RepID=UPI003D9B28A4